jgi:hypothetical protein
MKICKKFIIKIIYFLRVPFTYSIDLEYYEKLKNGPYYDEDFQCKDKSDECIKRGGGCPEKKGWEVGWSNKDGEINFNIGPSDGIQYLPIILFFSWRTKNVWMCQ